MVFENILEKDMETKEKKEDRFAVSGDLFADMEKRDISDIYRNHSEHGLKDDETIFLNWRVIRKETGRTMAVFGGGAGHDAAHVFKEYCENNY
jgi:2-phosphoglycerate kinase